MNSRLIRYSVPYWRINWIKLSPSSIFTRIRHFTSDSADHSKSTGSASTSLSTFPSRPSLAREFQRSKQTNSIMKKLQKTLKTSEYSAFTNPMTVRDAETRSGDQTAMASDLSDRSLIELIEFDEDSLLGLLDLYSTVLFEGDYEERERILVHLQEEIDTQMKLKEQFLYPAYSALESAIHRSAGIAESRAEMENIKKLANKFSHATQQSELNELALALYRHFYFEQKNLFHLFTRIPHSKLVQMGKQWKKMKFQIRKEAHAHHHPEAIQTE